ncbi:MAG TPA: septum formation initiator family protein [Syntrophorhabdaceae bacterium]|nr:septum formation initiator family protein [Syntrophorhabdaceae bacterium]
MTFILLSMLEDFIKKHGLLILLFVFIVSVIFYEDGLFSYIKMKVQISRIDRTIKKLEKENISLSQEIDRIRTDDKYLEEVVRMKYGLLREGEKLYRIER